jgi:hypothetical protein
MSVRLYYKNNCEGLRADREEGKAKSKLGRGLIENKSSTDVEVQ